MCHRLKSAYAKNNENFFIKSSKDDRMILQIKDDNCFYRVVDVI